MKKRHLDDSQSNRHLLCYYQMPVVFFNLLAAESRSVGWVPRRSSVTDVADTANTLAPVGTIVYHDSAVQHCRCQGCALDKEARSLRSPVFRFPNVGHDSHDITMLCYKEIVARIPQGSSSIPSRSPSTITTPHSVYVCLLCWLARSLPANLHC